MTTQDTMRLPAGRVAYCVEELRAALGIGRGLMYDLVATGQIRTVKAGRRTLIPAAALERYLAGATHAPGYASGAHAGRVPD